MCVHYCIYEAIIRIIYIMFTMNVRRSQKRAS